MSHLRLELKPTQVSEFHPLSRVWGADMRISWSVLGCWNHSSFLHSVGLCCLSTARFVTFLAEMGLGLICAAGTGAALVPCSALLCSDQSHKHQDNVPVEQPLALAGILCTALDVPAQLEKEHCSRSGSTWKTGNV